jgi:hypothetical protein
MRIIGAGFPRTGTLSLKIALEELLRGPCYHGIEIAQRLDDVPIWHDALRGRPPAWPTLLSGYVAAVDWPASAFWRELSEAYPSSFVLLSVRETAATWWESFDATVLTLTRNPLPDSFHAFGELLDDLLRTRLSPNWNQREAAIAAYEHHNRTVRATIPSHRLIEWRVGDGWGPICSALGLSPPEQSFPRPNKRSAFDELLATVGIVFRPNLPTR